MQKKTEKGTFGYLNCNKILAWKKAAFMLSVPILIFLGAWILKGTRENVMTVVAVVGCLPGCNQVVRAILAGRYASMNRSLYEQIEAVRGDLPVLYENVFTSYEKNYYIECVAVWGREVIGYSGEASLDPKEAAEHIRRMLKNSSYKQQVRILKEPEAFLKQLKKMAQTKPEPVPFHGDDRYPGADRDEIVVHLLQSITL